MNTHFSTISQRLRSIIKVWRSLNNLKKPLTLLSTKSPHLTSILTWASITLKIWMFIISTVMTSLIHLLLTISSILNSDKTFSILSLRHTLNVTALCTHDLLPISWMETPSTKLSISSAKDSQFQSSTVILILLYHTLALKIGSQFLTGVVKKNSIMLLQYPGQKTVLSMELKRHSKTWITDSFSNQVTWFLKISQQLLSISSTL